MLNSVGSYLLARLKEPSTWRGFILVATSFGMLLDPMQSYALVSLGLALAGSAAVITPDKLK